MGSSQWFSKFQLIGIPVIVTDSNCEIVFSNEPSQELTGLTPEDLNGMSFDAFFSKADQKRIREVIGQLSRGRNFFEKNLTFLKPNGKKTSVSLGIYIHKIAKKSFYVLTIEDTSEVSKATREKEDLIKMLFHREKLAEIGELATSIAHEMGNPLFILDGYIERIELLCKENEENALLEIQDAAERCQKATVKLTEFCRSITSLARSSEGGEGVVDIKEVCNDVIILLAKKFRTANIEALSTVSDFSVKGISGEIQQVVLNIVTNAIHAIEDCGRASGKIKIYDELGTEGFRSLVIWNDGPPIPEKLADKIFTPFFTTKGVKKGTGMGLSISANVMEKHHGRIEVRSNEEGTAFILGFPMSIEETGVEKKDFSVLVVEDEMSVRRVYAHWLERDGFSAFQALDGFEAIKILKKEKIDLVLLDLGMPRLNGEEVLKYIKKEHPSLIVAIVSGRDHEEGLKTITKRLGADEYFLKPVKEEQILDYVRRMAWMSSEQEVV